MLAYVFDFDGVIVDSMSLHLEAWEQAHKAIFDKPIVNPKRLAGMASTKITAVLCEENANISKKEELVNLKRDIMRKIYPDIPLLPGAREAFDFLKRNKIPVAICSNATREFIEKVLANQNLSVDALVTIESTPTPKPHPAPYILACNKLGISKEDFHNVAGFEDSKHGMRALQKAGLYAVGILSLQSKQDLISCGAKKVFPSLADAMLDKEIFSI